MRITKVDSQIIAAELAATNDVAVKLFADENERKVYLQKKADLLKRLQANLEDNRRAGEKSIIDVIKKEYVRNR